MQATGCPDRNKSLEKLQAPVRATSWDSVLHPCFSHLSTFSPCVLSSNREEVEDTGKEKEMYPDHRWRTSTSLINSSFSSNLSLM